jgi:hypothetical protein
MATTSAGTAYNIINVSTGTCATCTSTISPHPIWSDNTGGTIVQMSMITIGGSGLNS